MVNINILHIYIYLQISKSINYLILKNVCYKIDFEKEKLKP